MPEKTSSAASSITGLGLVAVVVAVLLGVAPGRKEGEKKPEPEPAAPAPGKPADAPAAQTYLEFLADRRLIKPIVVAGDPKQPPAARPSPEAAPGVRFLILTLPDPIDSQLGYWYDQSVDALTRAMSDLGGDDPLASYTLADRWFPWAMAVAAGPKDAAPRAARPKADPGVLVYRRVGDLDDRLVVLVVGENAISGLRVEALKAALDLAAQAPAGEGGSVRLVGPVFTGSQASLGRAILGWDAGRGKPPGGPGPRVTCVTGAALGLRPWGEILTADRAKRLDAVCGPITGTQVPLATLNRAVMHYLSRPGRTTPADALTGHPGGKVAYLVEANSGFGEAAAAGVHGSAALVFRFPMHIGRLAGIRSKDERARDERLGLIRPGEEHLSALDAARTGGDLVPAADEVRTALINQRLLADYWAVIRREGVRYVWVIATDKRDTLFLLEQLQAGCPDARPVVFGADLHYVYPDYLSFTRGVVVVGTYPLFPPAQRWQGAAGDPRRMPFPSAIAEGVYNAILATLGKADRMADYRPPGFGPTDRRQPPVWVTTVGENGEFYPLAYFTGYDDPVRVLIPAGPPDPAVRPEPPFGPPFLYLTAAVLLIVVAGAWWVWRVDGETRGAGGGAGGRLSVPGLRAQYVTLAGAGAVFAVLPLVLAFVSANWDGHNRGPQVLFGMTLGAFLLIAVGTLGYVYRQGKLTTAGHESGAAAGAVLAPWQVVAFTLLTAGVVTGWVLADHAHLPAAARYLFAERAAALYSGCSPAVPATVIGVGLLGYGLLGLQHLRLMTGFRVAPPYPDWGKGPPADVPGMVAVAVGRVHEAVAEIDAQSRSVAGVFTDPGERTGTRWLRLLVWGVTGVCAARVLLWMVGSRPEELPFLYWIGLAAAVAAVGVTAVVLIRVWGWEGQAPLARPRPSACVLLVAAGAASAVALDRAQPTWESRAWNCLFATGFLALGFLTLVAGYRLYLLWKRVEKVTRAVVAVPMVGAFDRFPDKLSRVFGAYLLSDRKRSLDLAIPLHLAAQLRAALATDLSPEADRLRDAINEVPGPPAADPGEALAGGQTDALCRAAARLVDALAPGWPARPAADAFGTLPPKPGDEPPPQTTGRDLAEQFVAVMVVIFLSQFMIRMRYLSYAAVATSGALLLAITAYQFEPERFLMYTAVGFAGGVVALMVWVLYRVNRNELVSRVTRSTPNRFQLDTAFVRNILVFVVPLAAVVATQLAGRMRGVVEPLLGWLR
jgi:hypothetical protein